MRVVPPVKPEGYGEMGGCRRAECEPASGVRHFDPSVLVNDLDAQGFCFFELGAGAGAGDQKVGLGGDRARHLGAHGFGAGLGFRARHFFKRAGEHKRLAGNR